MAAAQTIEQSDLERCFSLATSELKLACFEALTASEGKGAPSATEAAPEPLPESTATEKALISAGPAAGVAGSDAGRVALAPAAAASDDQADVADDLGQETPNEIQSDVAADLGREHPAEEQVDLAADLGREHLEEEKDVKDEETVVRATVSEVVKRGYDVLYFHFKNGQVWRQVESMRFSYPRDGEFDVIINDGMMGDYRLRLAAGGPMTRIRRVK